MTPQRAVAPHDWDAVLLLIRRAFAGMEGRIDPPSSLHALTAAGIARTAEEGEVWVIGSTACVLLTRLPQALYVGKLAVDPSAQRQGHGRALIGVAAERARAMGLPALELQTRVELVENHAAFRAMGFRKVAETAHPGFDRPTSFTFRLPV